eukprot:sb/3479353/
MALPLTFSSITGVSLKSGGSYIEQDFSMTKADIGSVEITLDLGNGNSVPAFVCYQDIELHYVEQLCRMAGYTRAALYQRYFDAGSRALIMSFNKQPIVTLQCPRPMEECQVVAGGDCTADDTLVIGCWNRPDRWFLNGVRLLSNYDPSGKEPKIQPYLTRDRAEGLVVFDMDLNVMTVPDAPRGVHYRTKTGTVLATKELLSNKNILRKICRLAGYNKSSRDDVDDVIASTVGNTTRPEAVLSPSWMIEQGLARSPLVQNVEYPRGASHLVFSLDPCQLLGRKFTDGFGFFYFDKEEMGKPEWNEGRTVEEALWISCRI